MRHSLSPAIHQAAFAATGLDWTFVAFEVPPESLDAAIEGMRALGIAGLSVTMPHKEAVVDLVDELSPAARELGAVNCVADVDGRLVGHNTDGDGLMAALDAEGVDVAGRRVVVLGAGGAARAVVRSLALRGAEQVVVVNRSADRAARAAALAGEAGAVGGVESLSSADVVVNATPVGMGEDTST
ncbi:MAG TPA: shikimate dehydrogenase, partial [Microthrixaceae bacterium]|nr:shikimate dehydrogenase [Microthrixaceae bacterium]